jgi:hypothetical protein
VNTKTGNGNRDVDRNRKQEEKGDNINAVDD